MRLAEWGMSIEYRCSLIAPSAQPLDDGGVGHAAALAHGLEAVAAAAVLQAAEQRRHDAHAARAEGVADGNGAAPAVVSLGLRLELLRPHQSDGGEGLVALDGVELVDLHARALEHAAGDGVGRR